MRAPPASVAQFATDRERLFERVLRRGLIADVSGERSRAEQRFRARVARGTIHVARERGLAPAITLAMMAPMHPEQIQRAAHRRRHLGAFRIGQAERERGAQVVVLPFEPREPVRLLRAAGQRRLGFARQRRVGVAVATADLRRLAAFLEPSTRYSPMVSSMR